MGNTADFERNGFRIEAELFEGPRGPYRFRVCVDGREIVCLDGDCTGYAAEERDAIEALRHTLRCDEEDAADEDFDGARAAAQRAALLRRVLA